MHNKQWILARRPNGEVTEHDLEFVASEIAPLKPGEVLVRNLYLSLDPTNRIWMSDIDQYMPPVQLGKVMRGITIGVVAETKNSAYSVGEIIQPNRMGWQEYVICTGGQKLKITPESPILSYMSALGPTGLTAYFGLLDIGRPKPGETVVVSAAAGAVGMLVGQIAKIKGALAVGVAGSWDKCEWVVKELGFDGCVNYREPDLLENLRQQCPTGIDVYFDNVGGAVLDAALTLLNKDARIPLCGLISSYNSDDPVPGPYMFRNLLMKTALLKGFLAMDYLNRTEEFTSEMTRWLGEKKIQWRVDVREGLEHAPRYLKELFTGGNVGKLVVRVSPEP